MAGNFFDQFDTESAAPPMPPPRPASVQAGGNNFFDQFDEAPPSTGAAIGRGIAQGLSANFSDEIAGLGDASGFPAWAGVIPGMRQSVGAGRMLAEKVAPSVFGSGGSAAYDETVARERAANEAASAAHPWAYGGGNVVGAIATAPLTPALMPFRAAQGAGIVARGAAGAGNLAATGAAYGAVAGAGEGQGDPLDRLPSAAQGAAIGGVAGPVMGGALHGARRAAGYLADNVAAVRNPGSLADRVVARNFERDSANLPAIADDIERAGAAGQQLTAADIAGPNTQALAGDVARTPGPGRAAAREFLESRQVGDNALPSQGDRISAQLGNILGDEGAIATADSIIARRSTEADKLYARAWQRKLDYEAPEGRKLLSLLDRVPESAKARANEILEISDRDGLQILFNPTPNANGKFTLSTAPNGRHWDYVKQALDDTIDANRNEVTGKLNTLGGAVQGLKTEILSSLDKLNPLYRVARQNFAGHSELLQALREGQSAFTPGMSTEAVEKALRGLTPGEREMYRLGAVNALRGQLANMPDGANKARAAFGRPALRDKIAAMKRSDPDGHSDFVRFLGNEQAMFTTMNKSLGGSPTAERLGNMADTDGLIGDLASAAVQAGTGRPREAIRAVWSTLKKVDPEKRGKVMNEARQVLLNPDPEALRSFMRRVESTRLTRQDRDQLYRTVASALPRGVVEAVVGGQ